MAPPMLIRGMVWLNAALAFAITMLMLAMVVATIVETLHRLIGLREKGLRQMLGALFDRVLKQYPSYADEARATFITAITTNRAPTPALARDPAAETGPGKIAAGLEVMRNSFGRFFGSRSLAELSLPVFMERLGSTERGAGLVRDVVATGTSTVDVALHEVAQKFDAFGREASVYFERRARLTSVVISLVVGVLLWVHPRDLMQTFLEDAKVRDQVIAQSAAVTQAFEKARDRPPAGDDATQAAQMKADRAAIEDEIRRMQNLGIPLGWFRDKWPHDADLATKLTTMLWLLLGGLLVGLGGPFWYDTVTSITNLRRLLGPAKASEAPTATGATPTDAAIAGFKVAAAAQQIRAEAIAAVEEDVAVG